MTDQAVALGWSLSLSALLAIPPGAQSRQVSAHTALGRGIREPHDVTFPSMRNRPFWKLAFLWPGLLYKLISVFLQSLPLSADQVPHLCPFQEATSPLFSHFPLPRPYLLLSFPTCLPLFQKARRNPLMGGNHQSPFGNRIKRQTVRQTARDRRKTDLK